MAFHVRDAETDRVVRELAAATGASITETIREACQKALAETRRPAEQEELRARLRAVRAKIAAWPQDDSVVIDKAFFDALYDE